MLHNFSLFPLVLLTLRFFFSTRFASSHSFKRFCIFVLTFNKFHRLRLPIAGAFQLVTSFRNKRFNIDKLVVAHEMGPTTTNTKIHIEMEIYVFLQRNFFKKRNKMTWKNNNKNSHNNVKLQITVCTQNISTSFFFVFCEVYNRERLR